MWHACFITIYVALGAAHSVFVPRAHMEFRRSRRWQADTKVAVTLWYLVAGLSLLTGAPTALSALLGSLLFIGGQSLVILAHRANPYFSPNLELPPELITTGIYRYLTHPAYCGMVLSVSGVWTYFGSPYAGAPALIYFGMMIYRIRQENLLLSTLR